VAAHKLWPVASTLGVRFKSLYVSKRVPDEYRKPTRFSEPHPLHLALSSAGAPSPAGGPGECDICAPASTQALQLATRRRLCRR
jgi:hypothetical protein